MLALVAVAPLLRCTKSVSDCEPHSDLSVAPAFPDLRGNVQSMDGHLTLREALASDRLADFVQQVEAHGVELTSGSEFERALALLITQRRSGPKTREHDRHSARFSMSRPRSAVPSAG
jgi:hypothetical protein